MELANVKSKLARYKLMVPGPVEVDDAVLAEMGAPVVWDCDLDFVALYKNTIECLKEVFDTSGDVLLLVSSATGGLEAAIRSLLRPAERTIVLINGFFGERLATIAQAHGIEVIPVTAPWGQAIDVKKVQSVMETQAGIAGLIGVHHETSTGVLNPVSDLGALCQEFDIPFIVDAISSLGGEELLMDAWHIDVCVATCNKCLESVPGLSPVAVSPRAWQLMAQKDNRGAGWYLNLQVWKQYREEWWDWHPAPVTIPTSNVLALQAALDNLRTEGVHGRIARYQNAAHFLRKELRQLGFELFVDPSIASSSITAVSRLPRMNVAHLISFLREEFGVLISDGVGETRGKIFRVGHMGKASSLTYIKLLIRALSCYLQEVYR